MLILVFSSGQRGIPARTNTVRPTHAGFCTCGVFANVLSAEFHTSPTLLLSPRNRLRLWCYLASEQAGVPVAIYSDCIDEWHNRLTRNAAPGLSSSGLLESLPTGPSPLCWPPAVISLRPSALLTAEGDARTSSARPSLSGQYRSPSRGSRGKQRAPQYDADHEPAWSEQRVRLRARRIAV